MFDQNQIEIQVSKIYVRKHEKIPLKIHKCKIREPKIDSNSIKGKTLSKKFPFVVYNFRLTIQGSNMTTSMHGKCVFLYEELLRTKSFFLKLGLLKIWAWINQVFNSVAESCTILCRSILNRNIALVATMYVAYFSLV